MDLSVLRARSPGWELWQTELVHEMLHEVQNKVVRGAISEDYPKKTQRRLTPFASRMATLQSHPPERLRFAGRDALTVDRVLLLGHARRELCSDAITQSDRFEILDRQCG